MTVQYRTNPAIGFELVARTETFVTRPALDHAGWKCEACRDESELRVCTDSKARLVVLCAGCRTTPDEIQEGPLTSYVYLQTHSEGENPMSKSDRPVPFADEAPIPFRLRVDQPSAELRAFIVPVGAQRFSTEPPASEKSGVRLKAVG